MLESELLNVLARIAELWPEAGFSASEIGILRERIRGLSFNAVLAGLAEIRFNQPHNARRPSMADIRDKARLALRQQTPAVKEERIIDWIRRDANAGLYDPGEPDADVIEQHFSFCWQTVKADHWERDQQAANSIRLLIASHCETALREVSWQPEQARAKARAVVGLKPGEKVELRRIFQAA